MIDPAVAAENLIGVLDGASLAVRTSAEEVLGEVAKRGWLPGTVIDKLWEAVSTGTAALHQGRIHAAVCVAAAVRMNLGQETSRGSFSARRCCSIALECSRGP